MVVRRREITNSWRASRFSQRVGTRSRSVWRRLPNQNCRPSVQGFTWKLRVRESTIRRVSLSAHRRASTRSTCRPVNRSGETVPSHRCRSTRVHIAARERYHAL